METTACMAPNMTPTAAIGAFAHRPRRFQTIVGADVYQDCIRLHNEADQEFVLGGVGMAARPSKHTSAAVKILSAAGFGAAVDAHGHSLRCMIELGCCGSQSLSMSELNGAIWVVHHPLPL